MKEDLKGYTGAVDGVEILRGLAVVAPVWQSPQHPQPGGDADIGPVLRRAIEVIGDREEAMRWLGTPVRALDYATPISCVNDSASREKVLAVLAQLEHGVL